MEIFLQQVLNGLAIGGSYALVAIGFTLIFGVLRVVYLAHGAVLVAGAYIGLFALNRCDSIAVALLAGMAGATLLGLVVEVIAVRTVRGQNHLIPLATTISAATIIHEVLRLSVQQGQPVAYPRTFASNLVQFGNALGVHLHATVAQIIVASVALLLFVSISVLINKSWMGFSIRSVAESPNIASILGVRVNAVSAQTVAIASALAGAAGVLLGLSVPAIDPYFGDALQFKALAIVLFGGLGSLSGAVLGGVILGVVEAIAAGYLDTSYRDLFAYLAMVLILLVRPWGLLGQATTQRV